MNSPVWLKAVCIVSIVLGALGLLMAMTGIAGQLFTEEAQKSTLRMIEAMQVGGLPPQMRELQQEMMDQSAVVQRRWMPINLAICIVHLFVATALLAGGIQALRMKASGRKLLLMALWSAILFELGRLPPAGIMQWEMSKIMGPFAQRMMDAAAPPGKAMPPGQKKTIQMIMRSSMVAGVLIGVLTAVGMAIVKLSFYGASVWLLTRPHFRAMYEPAIAATVR